MKKILCLLCTLILTMSCTLSVFACSPTYKPPKLPTIPEIHVGIPDEYKDGVSQAIDEHIKENLNIKLLNTPTITECRYIHGRAFWDKSRLQVRWDAVDEATSYEIKVTKSDGTEKTYTSDYTSLVVNKDEDDFITGCVMGGTVKVRAVKDNGALYSLWTEEDTIACNVLFH